MLAHTLNRNKVCQAELIRGSPSPPAFLSGLFFFLLAFTLRKLEAHVDGLVISAALPVSVL